MSQRKGSRGEKMKATGSPARPETGPEPVYDRLAGPAVRPWIRTDFVTLPADLSVAEMLSIIEGRKDDEVVIIRRSGDSKLLFYLFSCHELRGRLRGKEPEAAVESALDLHERDSAKTASRRAAGKSVLDIAASLKPTVVVDDGRVVGYCGFVQDLPRVKAQSEQTLAAPWDDSISRDRDGEILQSLDRDLMVFRTPGPRRGASRPKMDAAVPEGAAAASPVEVAAVPPEAPRPCHFAAQMAEEALLGTVQQVQATISREEIAVAAGKASQKGRASLAVAPGLRITVRLIPKRNFEVIGDSRADVKAPGPGEPEVVLVFDVRPTSPGQGELWVAFCRGPLSLVTLKLKPQILAEKSDAAGAPVEAGTTLTPPADEPLPMNVMHVDLVENGSRIRYRYWLLLDAAGIDHEYESPEFNDGIAAILKPYLSLFDQVEAGTAADFDQLQIQLRSIGAKLFQTLFPSDLQRVFWENRNRISHLKFYCEEPFIPWEILHVCEPDKRPPDDSKSLGQMGLIRWLPGHSAPRKLRIRPGRARYITPTYPGRELASAKKEGCLLLELFKASPVTPATRPEVTKLLAAKGPFDLFHFAGHGQASEGQITDARIELEPASPTASSQLRDLTPDIVSGLCDLKAEDGTQPIVVLNSCQAGKLGKYVTGISGFAPAFLEREAGLFVGALWMIGDEPAVTFIREFYRSLKQGAFVADAVVAGRNEAAGKGDATYLAYVVYGDPFARLVP